MKKLSMIAGLSAVSVLAFLAGCGGDTGDVPPPVAEAHSIVAKTDWSKSQTVDVALDSYAFRPAEFALQSGQPYKIHLTNGSDDTHTFSSAGFFKAVALQKVVVNGVEASGLSDDGVTLDENQQADLYLVPVTAGSYGLFCDEPLHDSFGMHGHIIIK